MGDYGSDDYEKYVTTYDECSVTAWKFLGTLVKLGALTQNDFISIRVGHVVKFINRYMVIK